MPFNSLRPIRERKGLTLAQLAGKTSISLRTLQSYEMGERTIAPDDLRKLSRVLLAPPGEILQPTVPPPPAPERTPLPPTATLSVTAPVPSSPAPSFAPPREDFRRPPFGGAPVGGPPRPPFGGMGPAPGAPARPPAARPPRPMRDSRPARPVLPATGGQLDQIRSLSRRLGLEEPALIEQIGRPIESLDHLGARSAIAKLRQLMEDSGTWQPRVGEGPDQEGEYLGKLRDRRLPIEVQLINGERLRGVIDDFTPYVVRLRNPDGGTEVSVRKLAIAYYQTPGPIDDAE